MSGNKSFQLAIDTLLITQSVFAKCQQKECKIGSPCFVCTVKNTYLQFALMQPYKHVVQKIPRLTNTLFAAIGKEHMNSMFVHGLDMATLDYFAMVYNTQYKLGDKKNHKKSLPIRKRAEHMWDEGLTAFREELEALSARGDYSMFELLHTLERRIIDGLAILEYVNKGGSIIDGWKPLAEPIRKKYLITKVLETTMEMQIAEGDNIAEQLEDMEKWNEQKTFLNTVFKNAAAEGKEVVAAATVEEAVEEEMVAEKVPPVK